MIIKTIPDKEKVNSIINLIKIRKEFVLSSDPEKFTTVVVENYYEIIKELATAILLLDGLKAIGEFAHKELIEELAKYKEFEESEIKIMDDLRIKRNKSSYEGKPIEKSYLENKKEYLSKIIDKLENLLNKKLK
ncbi:MAG: hypothetical protein PHD81_03815 [Candidatus Nanoarchaeia archaeon]|nr:hypothetical protein [Candidatus Nanoarchaeia archaeon]MDD5588209.1 hypothetical protein [Candidatus Nanoarchaeia archaeon]